MIAFKNLNTSKPYKKFKDFYEMAEKSKQKNIEAICISSFNVDQNQVDSRYVNLKYIIDDEWIFFSNYNSPKAIQFLSHQQISAVFYWNNINTQIRMKAYVYKTSNKISDAHFKNRNKKKNAISNLSNQSERIESYEKFAKDIMVELKTSKILKRSKDWGGFSFRPFYFEFWEGHEHRLNKREVYSYEDNSWVKYFRQP